MPLFHSRQLTTSRRSSLETVRRGIVLVGLVVGADDTGILVALLIEI